MRSGSLRGGDQTKGYPKSVSRVLGVDNHLEANQLSSDGGPVFRLELPGCSGPGVLLPDGRFLVHAGAEGRAESTASFD